MSLENLPMSRHVINESQWTVYPARAYGREVYSAARLAVEALNVADEVIAPWHLASDIEKNLALERVEALRLGQTPSSYGNGEVDTLFRCVAIAALRQHGAL